MSNDNSGAVFVNDRKTQDNHPDRTGMATINGVEYWVSGWLKKKGDKPYMSLSFKPKEAKNQAQQPAKPAAQPAAGGGDFPDDVPFARLTSNYSF